MGRFGSIETSDPFLTTVYEVMKDDIKVSDSQNKVTRSAIWVGSRVETSDPFRTRVHEVMKDEVKVSDSQVEYEDVDALVT